MPGPDRIRERARRGRPLQDAPGPGGRLRKENHEGFVFPPSLEPPDGADPLGGHLGPEPVDRLGRIAEEPSILQVPDNPAQLGRLLEIDPQDRRKGHPGFPDASARGSSR